MGVSQDTVSRIESSATLLTSTLAAYLRALGGKDAHVSVTLQGRPVRIDVTEDAAATAEEPSGRPSDLLARHRDQVIEIARRHGIGEVRVFGSIARGTDTELSDIDLLVRFDGQASLLDLVGFEQEVEAALGVGVDAVGDSRRGSPTLDSIRAEAVPL